MSLTPEALARQEIDAQLVAAGWIIQDVKAVNLSAERVTRLWLSAFLRNFDCVPVSHSNESVYFGTPPCGANSSN